MDKQSVWKWLLLIALTAWSIAVVYPPSEKIRLGLDLQGGTRFVLQVETAELDENAARDAQARAIEVIRNRVDAMGVAEPVIYAEPGNRIVVEIPGLKTEDRARAIKNIQSAAYLEFRLVHPENDRLVEDFLNKGVAPEGYRIVTVPTPGGREEKLLRRDKSRDPVGTTEEEVRRRVAAFNAPPGYELLLERVRRNEQDLFRPAYVHKRAELKGDSIANAGIDYDMVQRPVVTLSFDRRGAKRFENLTRDYAPGGAKNPGNQMRQLAIVLDGTLYSAPTIREPIYGGNAQITGSFTLREAQDLALVLRAGALPAPVRLLEERTVDPTLGQDSIASGRTATLIGAAATVLFMVVYYQLAGVVANGALLMNLVLFPVALIITGGFLSVFANTGEAGSAVQLPTLTLPGIAGIALTIGMAVDANVLIFERMREEQKLGKRFKFVIEAGYQKAWSAIFDANITTLITAIILFWQGTGPVRGYAVTLSAGVIVSMYTALVITRMLFDLLSRGSIQSLRMLELIRETRFDFLRHAKLFIGLSVAVIVATWGVFISKGPANFGVDFLGGDAVTLQFSEKAPVDQIRATLEAAGIRDATIQYQRAAVVEGSESIHEYLEIKSPFGTGKQAAEAITGAFAAQGFRVIKEDSIGPQIGRELQRKAIIATLAAMAALIIYVSIRFEFPFAVGAVVAVFHDVLIAVGVFCLLGGTLDLTMIAAVLTIIGYSVNDTIVIFDRIRENLKLNPGKPFAELANLSINQTLSRTILTTLTTLFVVVALLLFGGGAIYELSMLLFIGMIAGIYSTIYIATPVAMLWHRKDKAPTGVV
ncbi:MAG: protein translocase subunit SecD [Kiritimatiellae bacterium]|nr:protein translocase subunit SecD [Kiritimatiellia bacterium]MDW8458209.1 protein translocase subunit SecD [Verrucomicrobiota bacterium]